MEKVVEGNSRDRAMSSVVATPLCVVALVAPPINPEGERAGKALRGVRWAHITNDGGDSITPQEGRGPAWCMAVLGAWRSPFPQG